MANRSRAIALSFHSFQRIASQWPTREADGTKVAVEVPSVAIWTLFQA